MTAASIKKSAVILISGNGSNLQAIIDASQQKLPLHIAAVISNNPDAYGLTRAEKAGITTHLINHRHYPDRVSFDAKLQQCIDQHQPDLIILAGFMRILTDALTEHYLGQMINIHPSLLPKYPGLNTHQQVLANKDSEHGASIHYVTQELDGGPVIAQSRCKVTAEDDLTSLTAKVQQLEHQLYWRTINEICQGNISLHNGQVYSHKRPLTQGPLQF